MHQEIVMAGMGGQGIMSMGQLLAYAAMSEDRNVVWFPSYGPESRGGTADCTVIISTEPIGSPISSTPDSLIALNQALLDKFAPRVRPGGLVVVNTSLASADIGRADLRVVGIPAQILAEDLGTERVTNMVILGCFVAIVAPVSQTSLELALGDVLPEHRQSMIPLNISALRSGAAFARQMLGECPASS